MKPDVETEAKALLEQYARKMGHEAIPPVPIEHIAETICGFDVLYTTLPEDESGQTDFARKLISIQEAESLVRQRFSIGHEVGHIRLHGRKVGIGHEPIPGLFGDTTTPHLSRKRSRDWWEIQANRFAAAILMPYNLLLKAFDATAEEYSKWSLSDEMRQHAVTRELAKQFEVSTEAMGYRLKNTNIMARLFMQDMF